MPYQAAFVSLAFLVCQHRDQYCVWMDSGALDVCGVGDAVADVFDRGGRGGRDDADFRCAEFAQVADECC